MLVINFGMTFALTAMVSKLNPISIGETFVYMSKPYWTKELTSLSDKLRKALKAYSTRNTDKNLSVLQEVKHEFEEARKLACQKFILDKTNYLNTAQSCKFWKEFNRHTSRGISKR